MTRTCWLYWPKAVDTARVFDLVEEDKVEDATVFSGVNLDHRRSKISWITDKDRAVEILSPFVLAAAQNMGIEVLPIADFQYTEYHGTDSGKYDWHHDINWVNNSGNDRKLSVTVQLSDSDEYEGGNFEFGEVETPPTECRQKGTVLVFPSYLQHRVSPVTSGVRKTLVAWFEGPTWR
jgi:PKHD-type hydroxylase